MISQSISGLDGQQSSYVGQLTCQQFELACHAVGARERKLRACVSAWYCSQLLASFRQACASPFGVC